MNTLLTCIQNEANAMAELVDVLRQEQALLTQAPSLTLMEEISAITHKKNQTINSISQIGKLRNNELSRLGFRATETTMPKWLQNKDQVECWSTLIKQTKKANELNRVNGLLINRHLLRNQSTLQVLLQNHPTNAATNLYSANGQSNAQRTVMRGFGV